MSISTKHLLAAAALGTIGIGQTAAQTVDWTGSAGDGLWNTGGNWAGGLVPSGSTAVARFADPADMAAVSLNVPAIGSLQILDPAAVVFIDLNSSLTLEGAASTNNGLINLNRNNSSLNAILSLPNSTTFNGSGEIVMQASNNNSQIAGVGTLVNGTMHTVRGVGQVNAGIVNMGRMAADVSVALSGNDLEIRAGGQNSGTLAATTGSLLQIINSPIVQTGSGQIAAEGGQVEFLGTSSVTGGTLESNAGGFLFTSNGSNVTMTDVTNNADLRVDANSTMNVAGMGIVNDAIISLNNQNSSLNAVVLFQNSGSLAGSGEMRLLTSINDNQLNSAAGATIDHAASHTIRGAGEINAAMDNAGLIAADISVTFGGRNTLELQTNDKTNSGLIESRLDAILNVEAITIDQTSGGEIRATDGEVRFIGAAQVLGGDVTSSGAGSVAVRSGSTTSFDNVDINAAFFVDANGTLNIDAGGITNNGDILVNNQNSSLNGTITTDDAVTIDGSGTIVFRTASTNSFMTTTGTGSITLGSGQLVTGTGDIDATIINNGVIAADASQAFAGIGVMDLDVGPFTNNNLMTAEAASELRFNDVLVMQTPSASIESIDGLVSIGTASRIEGGALASVGSGVFRTFGGVDRELSGVTLNGVLQIEANSTVSVDNAGLVNNGLIEINRNNSSLDGNLDLSDGTITGTGEIQLRTGSTNSFIRTDAGTTGTIGSGQLVRGAGFITGEITNNGVIAADTGVSISGSELVLTTNDKINNNQLRAEAGSLLSIVDVGVDQSSGGSMLADAGRVEFRNASMVGGTLGTVNDGTWATDTGVNSFDGVAISGTGAVDANTTLNVIGNTLTSDAAIIINPGNSSLDGVIQINEDTSFAGSGTMDFRTAGIGNSRVSAAAGLDPLPTLTNAAGHTMSGVATVQVPMINEGTIVVGRPTGDFIVTQPLALAPSSQFNVAIGGNLANGQLDPTGVDGSVALGGTLNVALIDGLVLTNNFNHIIVDGPYTGEFDTVNLAVEGQLITRVRYETDQVVLRTRCLADTNLDGNVTPADFNSWIAAFNMQDNVADQNLDGLISPADFNAWIINFNMPCP